MTTMKIHSSFSISRVAVAGVMFWSTVSPVLAGRSVPAGKGTPSASPEIRQTADSLNALAANLFEHTAQQEKGNLFFSPYSIQTALGMAYAGARGQTATEMAQTLHFSPTEDTHARLSDLQKLLNGGLKGGNTLDTANGLWVATQLKLVNSFATTMETCYNGALHSVETFNESVRNQINGWVAQKTREKIKDLIPQGGVNEMTRLVLANAIYFKGTWTHKFDSAQTRNMDFQTSNGKTVKAPMMFQKQEFSFSQDESVQVLEMPYQGDELAMVIVLPKARNGLESLKVTPEALKRWCGSAGGHPEVSVWLPKFKMAWKSEMKDTLSKMGMPTVFTDGADLSGIDGRRDLYISKVFHKAWVEVDEKGTEAAAATGVAIATLAFIEPVEFKADHPFLFLIHDKRSGAILFMGRLTDPTQTGE
jgi:serine protease inhibitor